MRRPAVAIAALCLGAYAYFYQAGGWNQNSRFDLVRALVEQRTSVIDRYHRNTGDKSCRGPEGPCKRPDPRRGRHVYCDKAPGASWLGVPAYALVYAAWGGEHPSPTYLARASWLVTVTAVAVPSAVAVAMLFWLLGALGVRPPLAAAAALAYGLGTLAFPYATLFYGHQLMAALVLAAFAILVRMRHHGPAPGPARLVIVGALLGWAVVVEYPAALAVVCVGAYAATFVRPWPRLGWIAAGMAGPGLLLAAYHWAAFGGPLTLPYEFSTQVHRHQGFFMGLGTPDPEALENILITGYRGLFWSAPWLVLAVPGGVVLARRGHLAEVLTCAGVFVLFVWLNASLVDWQGGWALGARYLIPAIPFLAVAAAGVALWLQDAPRRVAVPAGIASALLAGYAAFLMLAGTAVKPEVPTHIQRPFGQYVLPAFYDGELAVSTQSIDSPAAPPDGPRHAWNLGHGLGLDGLASLLPLALWIAGTGAWLGYALSARGRCGAGSGGPSRPRPRRTSARSRPSTPPTAPEGS